VIRNYFWHCELFQHHWGFGLSLLLLGSVETVTSRYDGGVSWSAEPLDRLSMCLGFLREELFLPHIWESMREEVLGGSYLKPEIIKLNLM